MDRPASLRDRVAQLVMPRLGSRLDPVVAAEDDAARVVDLVTRCPVGGVIVFHAHASSADGHGDGLAEALARVQDASAVPLLALADLERGAGQQVAGATLFPHAMAVGHADAPEAHARTLARLTAIEAQAMGLHGAFAPVADVHLEPENPIIATRTFGAEPARVAACVRAFVDGAAAEGFVAVAKHAPGHGRTRADSHATLPVVQTDLAMLAETDLVPFRAAVEAGVEGLMTAHVAYPALDATGRPATASARIVRGLLRGEDLRGDDAKANAMLRHALGFQGVVFSDSLRMEGIAGIDPADLLRAGVDVLLDPPDAEATVRAVVRAVEEGRLADDVVEAACARVLRLKQRVADRWGTPDLAPPPAEARAAVDRAKHRRAADAIARAAVRVLDDAPGALPLDPRARTLVLLAAPERLTTDAEAFAAVVRRHLPAARVRLAPPDLTPEDAADVAEVASASEAVVCALVVEPAAWQRYGLAEPQVRVVRALAEAAGPRRPVVVAALGSPHVLADVPSGAARVCTYSAVPASQRALFAHLVGMEDGG